MIAIWIASNGEERIQQPDRQQQRTSVGGSTQCYQLRYHFSSSKEHYHRNSNQKQLLFKALFEFSLSSL